MNGPFSKEQTISVHEEIALKITIWKFISWIDPI